MEPACSGMAARPARPSCKVPGSRNGSSERLDAKGAWAAHVIHAVGPPISLDRLPLKLLAGYVGNIQFLGLYAKK